MSDTLNLANSIWPNGMKVDSDGHAVFYPLGTNKVEVPTSSSAWPKGNKLISPFVYQDEKLVGFVDTKALTTDSQTTIYLPYEHIEAQFSAIEKGQLQIHAPNATTKKASWKDSGVEDIPDAQFKYKGCETVQSVTFQNVNYDYLADISNGTWSEPLWDLEQGNNGGQYEGMFYSCSALTSFSSDLPSLTDGEGMFSNCKLDTASVQNIADTINTVTDKPKIHIGIGNTTPNEQEEAAFNKMVSKGWTVYVGVKGESASEWIPTSLTPLDGEEISTPIPFYAKPVPSDEQHARYIDEQGNYYNILGGQFIYGDDLSTYGMFTSEEDAAMNMRLTKIEE